MADQQGQSPPNWFERHPKKTILGLVLILMLAATYGAEKLLAYINHTHNLVLFSERRYINLREILPLIDTVDVPPDKAVRESDGLVQKPYRVRTDARGFMLPYNRYEKPDLTLFFLGGSTVACIYVEEENRFPYLVGQLLAQKTGKKITSINSGVGGNNSLHSLDILLNKIIPVRPDVVVMMHNINDLVALIYDRTYWSKNPTRAAIVNFSFYKNLTGLKALSTLARDMYIPNLHAATRILSKKIFGKKVKDPDDEFASIRGKKLTVDQAHILAEFKMNLSTFINICRARRITPVLMTQFNRYKDNPDPKVLKAMQGFESDSQIPVGEFMEIYARFNDAIREVGKANGVLVIDLAALIPQDKQYIYDVVHLNTRGSQLAAQLISQRLQPLVAR
ncbi:MAG: SGNH/GDSL hydrolase family protein [Desulfobacterales bacterium]|nr:SGNH/GDSL hydrolase family protein [Pseudomonadota bacterium]MBU4354485.1 SGNH/GDSL hydrolase family protein [Pseudomonadota bacterium]MCG2770680.1 SGNH/GDSL hydrolase family protein [Desulfobacterales bacterium]